MLSKEITIINRLGLHARAAAKFVNLASAFDSEINLSRNGHTVNGKSIMGVMMLAAAKGTTLGLSAEGDDAEEALQQLEALVAQRFGEEE
jgi:phosphocarrier protein HPr